MKIRWLIISLLLITISCEDTIEVEVPDSDPRLVVEGVISDRNGPQMVRISTSNNFNDPERTPKVSGANVQVVDDDGFAVVYTETVVPGTYNSDIEFSGQVGKSYKLQFQLPDGSTYESDFQELKPTPTIDALTFAEDLTQDSDGFIVSLVTTDNNLTQDFYRWRIFRNEEQVGTLADVFLRSDRLFNGNPFSVEFENFVFAQGDVCRVEQFSLSEDAFDFFRLVQIQAGEIGESTSTAPAQVSGNVRNINATDEVVLGFFYATSITEERIVLR